MNARDQKVGDSSHQTITVGQLSKTIIHFFFRDAKYNIPDCTLWYVSNKDIIYFTSHEFRGPNPSASSALKQWVILFIAAAPPLGILSWAWRHFLTLLCFLLLVIVHIKLAFQHYLPHRTPRETIAVMSCQSPWRDNKLQPSSKSISLILAKENWQREKKTLRTVVSVLLSNPQPCEWFTIPVVLLWGRGHCTGTCDGSWTHDLWRFNGNRDKPQPPPHWEPLQAGQH